ncbi:MAG: hypothetical protein JSR80_00095 [Verrucomicrobia bacterium]|nr:hypothetical protein [Verrucomicrobiota bacterium]
MPTKHPLEFACVKCGESVALSLVEGEMPSCASCGKRYTFEGTQLQKQLRQFEALCRQIQASKEIFSEAAVAVDVGPSRVRIPLKLLLTRLNSVLDLEIEGVKTTITFRVEALNEQTGKTS